MLLRLLGTDLEVKVNQVLLVHVPDPLTDLSHVGDAVLLCQVVLLFHKPVKQLSTGQSIDNTIQSQIYIQLSFIGEGLTISYMFY